MNKFFFGFLLIAFMGIGAFVGVKAADVSNNMIEQGNQVCKDNQGPGVFVYMYGDETKGGYMCNDGALFDLKGKSIEFE